MPDMSLEAVHSFWHNYDKRTLYRIITSMEGVESWASDDDAGIQALLTELGEALDDLTDVNISNEELVVKVLANLKTSRALRLMQFLDVLKPGTASKLLIYAEERTKNANQIDAFADLFLKRNLSFERLQLLVRVFAPERLNLIVKSLEAAHE